MSKPIKNFKFSDPISITSHFEKSDKSSHKTAQVAIPTISSSWDLADSKKFFGDKPIPQVAKKSGSAKGSYGFHVKDGEGLSIFANPAHLKKK